MGGGLASGNASYSSSQLTAAQDGSEEVRAVLPAPMSALVQGPRQLVTKVREVNGALMTLGARTKTVLTRCSC